MGTSTNKVNLLIVDDEKDFLEASEQALVRRGFIVETAPDGATALAMIAEQMFDAVLLDIKMPGLDGVEVFQHIRRMSPNLPVVMLTGHGNIQQAFETSKDGVFQYLTKPCSVEKIVGVVRAAINDAKEYEASALESLLSTIRLLLIDENIISQEQICKALRRSELQITTASNTDEAIRLLDRLYFDVVLINIDKTNAINIALIKYIKQTHSLSEIICIIPPASDITTVEDIKHDLFETIVKPVSPNYVEKKIRQAYQRRKQKESEQQKENIRNILEGNTE